MRLDRLHGLRGMRQSGFVGSLSKPLDVINTLAKAPTTAIIPHSEPTSENPGFCKVLRPSCTSTSCKGIANYNRNCEDPRGTLSEPLNPLPSMWMKSRPFSRLLLVAGRKHGDAQCLRVPKCKTKYPGQRLSLERSFMTILHLAREIQRRSHRATGIEKAFTRYQQGWLAGWFYTLASEALPYETFSC